MNGSDHSRARRDGLIEEYRDFVATVVDRLLVRMNLPRSQRQEYISSGYIGLIEAAERFDESKCADFRGYAFLRIRGAILDTVRASCDVSNRAYKVLKALEAANADALEGLEPQGGRAVKARLPHVIEYLAKSALAYRLSGVMEVGEAPSHAPLTPEDELSLKREATRLREIVGRLPEKERLVIEQYYFHGRRFTEIALDDAGLSKSWVSRIHSRALKMIREEYEKEIAHATC
jgi:RNA polymerase sigma factor for flagellar operon FliA